MALVIVNDNLASYMTHVQTSNANPIQIYNAWILTLSDQLKKEINVKTAIHCLDFIELSKTEYENETIGAYLKEGQA